ncbi:flippase-like domain-containing protein [Fructobacillus sp. M1-13]|uniref:Phosphatidylglycerol lysyltransferase n=1 Tax=Fructobacillus papyriferae TaxID=2713171 RepID=A0ABS5QQC7_9LACO|nr:lysylphosphatidylglycerol synthase transmembrane domain-containing protein [Fructobacillus papyriferae]MBS9335404.1 flippase-like domain-containing protein [Fructobacillus papyriferae]MCD2158926.1 flippase-like domain-containing protein [Fructobacillus papyriferae]
MSRRNQLSALIVLLMTGLVIYYLTNELAGRGKQLEAALKVLDWRFLLIGFLMMVLSLLLEAFATHALLSQEDRRETSWGTLLRVPLLNQLGVGLTPFATGGQPAQLYALTRGKMPASRALSVILMKFLVYQIVVVLFFIIGYFAAEDFIYENVNPAFATFIPFAIGIHAVVIIGILLVMFWPALSLKVVDLGAKLIKGIYKGDNLQQMQEKAHQKIVSFHEESKRVIKSSRALAVATAYTGLQLIALYVVPYFVIRAFGYVSVNPFLIIAMNIMIVMVISLFPIPGGVGGAELSFQLLFTPFVKNPATLILVILIWRLITYYFCLFAGILAYVIPTKEQKEGRHV